MEALGILNASDVEKGTVEAFKIGDFWINDTALRSCRHLSSIGSELEKSLEEMLDVYNRWAVYTGFRRMKFSMSLQELNFSLKLSEAFKHFQELVAFYRVEKLIKIPLFLLFLVLFLYISSSFNQNKFIPGVLGVVFPNAYTYLSIKIESLFLTKKKRRLEINFHLLITIFAVTAFPIILPYFENIYGFKFLVLGLVGLILISLGLLILLIFLLCILLVFRFFIAMKRFHNLRYDKISDRSYIAEVYLLLSGDRYHMTQFVSYLENNVKEASGNFPPNFLQMGTSTAMTRLIQLEERWRESEERKHAIK